MARLDVYAVAITPVGPLLLGPPEVSYSDSSRALTVSAPLLGQHIHRQHAGLEVSTVVTVMACRGQATAFYTLVDHVSVRPDPSAFTTNNTPSIPPQIVTYRGRAHSRNADKYYRTIFAPPFLPERADIDNPDWFYQTADYYADDGHEQRADVFRETARALEALYSTSPGLIRYADRHRR